MHPSEVHQKPIQKKQKTRKHARTGLIRTQMSSRCPRLDLAVLIGIGTSTGSQERTPSIEHPSILVPVPATPTPPDSPRIHQIDPTAKQTNKRTEEQIAGEGEDSESKHDAQAQPKSERKSRIHWQCHPTGCCSVPCRARRCASASFRMGVPLYLWVSGCPSPWVCRWCADGLCACRGALASQTRLNEQ